MSSREPEASSPLPPYSYVPGGPWPHPTGSPLGSLRSRPDEAPTAIQGGAWADSRAYLRGIELFNAGYYWEAHEAWEGLWHAHGRRGVVATVLKGLIKLAAAGVKIREGREAGARSLARRAAEHFAEALAAAGAYQLGLDLSEWIQHAESVADQVPADRGALDSAVHCVFLFKVCPLASP